MSSWSKRTPKAEKPKAEIYPPAPEHTKKVAGSTIRAWDRIIHHNEIHVVSGIQMNGTDPIFNLDNGEKVPYDRDEEVEVPA